MNMTSQEDFNFEQVEKAAEQEAAEDELKSLPRVTKEDILFVLETMYKEAPYDKTSLKQLFFGMCSAFTKTGIPHNVNSKTSGAGKNYLLDLCAKYFPDKHVEQLVGASDKAFLHRRGELVIKDEETGELKALEPIVDLLEQEIGTLGDLIDEEKARSPSNKSTIKKFAEEIKEKQNQIKSLLKRQQKLIDLNNLIIIIADTPQEGFFANLMSLMSQDSRRDQEYLFTDKTFSGRAESTANILRGMPVIFSAQVIDDTDNKRFAEKNRRSVLVTPNTSEEKIAAALDLMGKQGLLPEEYDEQVVSRKDQERAKEIATAIVEKIKNHSKHLEPRQYGTKLSFHSAIAHCIPRSGVWSMTVMKRIQHYLAIVTKVNMDDRPRIINTETGAFYPISTFEDLRETWELMERGGSNVRAYLAECYNKVILPVFRELDGELKERKSEDGRIIEKETHVGLTTEEIGQAIHVILRIPTPGIRELRETYLYPLANHGLINYTKSILNRNENIWAPVDEKTNAFSLFKSNDLRLTVIDANVYPTPNVIEKEYSIIIKQEERGGTQNKKNIFRLLDSDGTEITVAAMIEKYFQNPESCFTKGFDVE